MDFSLAVFLFSEKGDSFADDLDVPFFLLQFDGEFQDSVVEVLQQFIALGDAVPVLVVLIAQALYVRPALFEAGIDPSMTALMEARADSALSCL